MGERLGVGDVVDLLADSPQPATPHHVKVVRPVELLVADPQLEVQADVRYISHVVHRDAQGDLLDWGAGVVAFFHPGSEVVYRDHGLGWIVLPGVDDHGVRVKRPIKALGVPCLYRFEIDLDRLVYLILHFKYYFHSLLVFLHHSMGRITA